MSLVCISARLVVLSWLLAVDMTLFFAAETPKSVRHRSCVSFGGVDRRLTPDQAKMNDELPSTEIADD